MKNLLIILLWACCGMLHAQISFVQTGCNQFDFSFSPSPSAIQWDFGDGQSTNTLQPTHYYGSTGTYTVTALVNGVISQQLIVVDDCCQQQSISLTEFDNCCFQLTVTNGQDQFFTGLDLSLQAPGGIGGYSFNPGSWVPLAPPTANSMRLSYIGGPHIPLGPTGGVNICLTGDTGSSGPLEVYGSWTIGPDTICTDTSTIACELCVPEDLTFNTTIDAIYDPNDTFDLNEYGYAVLPIDTSRILYGGISQRLDGLGILDGTPNMVCGIVDECGDQTTTLQAASFIDPTIHWLDFQLIDLRGQSGACNYSFAKVGTVRSGSGPFVQDAAVAYLDAGYNIVDFRLLTTTSSRETVEDVTLHNGYLFIVGHNFRNPPLEDDVLLIREEICGGITAAAVQTVQLGNRSRAYSIHHLGIGEFLVTGSQDDRVFVLPVGFNLNPGSPSTYDLDGNPANRETGKAILQNAAGDIIIFGEQDLGSGVSVPKRLFFLRLANQTQVCPMPELNSQFIDLSDGDETVVDAMQVNSDLFLTGVARRQPFVSNGQVPDSRVYFSRLDAFGNVMSLTYYTNAMAVNQLARLNDGFLLAGTSQHQGPFQTQPFPQPTVLNDIWLGRVDRNGVMADCDCFEPLDFDELPTTNGSSCASFSIRNSTLSPYPTTPFNTADLDSLQNFCGMACGEGGVGDPCPSGCCGFITGKKFEDRDGNGVQDSFDPDLCGWTIHLSDATGIIATTTTNQAGVYAFTNLCPGTYVVSEQLPNCWSQTHPTAGTHTVTVNNPNYQHYNIDFGNQLNLDCSQLNAGAQLLASNGDSCEYRLLLDNNVCPDVVLMRISSPTAGIILTANTYQPGFTDYLPRPNGPDIWVTGGNNNTVRNPLGTGNGLSVVDFSVATNCMPPPSGLQVVYVDYYVDLPCSLSDSYCRDTIILECPLTCPGDCEVAATATPTVDMTDLCCYDVSFFIDPVHQNEFTNIQLRTSGGTQFTSYFDATSYYALQNNTATLKSLKSNVGAICPANNDRYFPTGVLPSVEICVGDFAGAMPIVEAVFVKCDGSVCRDTMVLDCSPCIEVVNDSLYCAGDTVKYRFDFQNTWNQPIKRLVVNNLQPGSAVVTPDTLFFPLGIPVGAYAGPQVLCFDNVSHPDSLKFNFKALGDDDCCFCISNLICEPVPFCCDTCESIRVLSTPLGVPGDSCCYSLDLYHCTDSLFTGIKLSTLGGVTFNRLTADQNSWFMQSNPPGNHRNGYFHPKPTPAHGTYIPTGWSYGKIEFCFDSIDSPLDVPQFVVVDWLAGSNTNIVCSDTLTFECQPREDTCVLISDTLWTCLPDGSYQLDLAVTTFRTGITQAIYLDGLHSIPAGAIVNPDPNIVYGSWPQGTQVSLPSMQVSNVSPGDSICFYLAASDTTGIYMNDCCYTDTICLVVPECPTTGNGFMDCDSIDLPVYDHDYLGWAAVTCFSGYNDPTLPGSQINNGGYTAGLIDVRANATAPLNGANWAPTMRHFPSFTADTIGQVFGLAVDEDACIYVSATTHYGSISNSGGFQYGVAGPGGVYKLCPDASGTYTLSATASLQNVSSGLGQITYDPVHHQVFVSNFHDGLIYRLDAATLTTLSTFNPPNSGCLPIPVETDFVPLGCRPYGVGYNVFENRLYYSIWAEDARNNNDPTAINPVYSIALDATGDFSATPLFEFDLPGVRYLPIINSIGSMPISDLAFSNRGEILVSERTTYDDIGVFGYGAGHEARVMMLTGSSGNWINPTVFHIGSSVSLPTPAMEMANSGGGVDFGLQDTTACDSLIWATGNLLSGAIYGITGVPRTGNSSQASSPIFVGNTSINIDFDGVVSGPDASFKNKVGDVELFRDPCCGETTVPNVADCVAFDSLVNANGFSITVDSVTGLLNFNPPPGLLPTDWYDFDESCDGIIEASQVPGDQSVVQPSTPPDLYFCVDVYRVIDGDTCHVHLIQDGDVIISTEEPAATVIDLKLFPNPAKEQLHLAVELARESRLAIEIFDFTGRRLLSEMHESVAGSQQISLDLRKLPAGSYLLRLSGEDFVSSRRFIKLR